MKPKRLLLRLRRGHFDNVDFDDFCRLIAWAGFRLDRTRGSHRVYAHPDVPERLVVQPRGSKAKSYQLRDFATLVREYDLDPEA